MPAEKPLITYSQFGKKGRFANHCFQYMFLSTYAEKNNLEMVFPHWDGEAWFHVAAGSDNIPSLPLVKQRIYNWHKCPIASGKPLKNVDFVGFFQYSSEYYAWAKEKVRREFSFKGAYAEIAEALDAHFRSLGRPVVTLHLRRGDYGWDTFFIAPNRWYVSWLRRLKAEIGDFALYIATDDPSCIGTDFAEFDVIMLPDVEPHLPHALPGKEKFLIDFMAMIKTDVLATSNSTFSFFASLLNERAPEAPERFCVSQPFMRPSLTEKALIPYDPWSSYPLLSDMTAEEAGDEYLSDFGRERKRKKWWKIHYKRYKLRLRRKLGLE